MSPVQEESGSSPMAATLRSSLSELSTIARELSGGLPSAGGGTGDASSARARSLFLPPSFWGGSPFPPELISTGLSVGVPCAGGERQQR